MFVFKLVFFQLVQSCWCIFQRKMGVQVSVSSVGMYYVGFSVIIEIKIEGIYCNRFICVGFVSYYGYVVMKINFKFMNDSKVVDGQLC